MSAPARVVAGQVALVDPQVIIAAVGVSAIVWDEHNDMLMFTIVIY